MSLWAAENLTRIRAALDHHNNSCPVAAMAILLNPIDHDLLGLETVWGLPVRADEEVEVKRVRIKCPGSAWKIEDELEQELLSRSDLREPVPK